MAFQQARRRAVVLVSVAYPGASSPTARRPVRLREGLVCEPSGLPCSRDRVLGVLRSVIQLLSHEGYYETLAYAYFPLVTALALQEEMGD